VAAGSPYRCTQSAAEDGPFTTADFVTDSRTDAATNGCVESFVICVGSRGENNGPRQDEEFDIHMREAPVRDVSENYGEFHVRVLRT